MNQESKSISESPDFTQLLPQFDSTEAPKVIEEINNLVNQIRSGAITTLPETTQINLRHCERILKNNPHCKEIRHEIQIALTKLRNLETQNPQCVEFGTLCNELSPEQQAAFGQTIKCIQLTAGCSLGCGRCNFNAPKKVRKYLSWECLKEITQKWGKYFKKNETSLYLVSDPLDWEDGTHTYWDVLQLIHDKCGYYPTTRTAVPKGKEKLAKRIWQSPACIEFSISDVNAKRLGFVEDSQKNNQSSLFSNFSKIFRKRFKNYLEKPPGNKESSLYTSAENIPLGLEAGVDYNYYSHERGINTSVGGLITPDGFFNMAAVNTITPLTPDSFVRFPVNKHSDYFLDPDWYEKSNPKKIFVCEYSSMHERHYYKPLKIIRVDGSKDRLHDLLDFQAFESLYAIISGKEVSHYLYPAILHKDENGREIFHWTEDKKGCRFRWPKLTKTDFLFLAKQLQAYLQRDDRAIPVLLKMFSHEELTSRLKNIDSWIKNEDGQINNDHLLQYVALALMTNPNSEVVSEALTKKRPPTVDAIRAEAEKITQLFIDID